MPAENDELSGYELERQRKQNEVADFYALVNESSDRENDLEVPEWNPPKPATDDQGYVVNPPGAADQPYNDEDTDF